MQCKRCGNVINKDEVITFNARHRYDAIDEDAITICKMCGLLWHEIYEKRFRGKNNEASVNNWCEWNKLFDSFMKRFKVKVVYT